MDGATLGERHRSLNGRTRTTVSLQTPFEEVLELPESCDIDRLYKIDVAASAAYRRVDYLLLNLKTDDTLYVSRALKKSIWLFTEPQYADIINPGFLERDMFPFMSSKAVAKTLLFARLYIKDESRAEIFYKYFEDMGAKNDALKWLPKCSLNFILDKVIVEFSNINLGLYKRLCERSFKVFEVYMKKLVTEDSYRVKNYMSSVVFLLNTNTEEYLDVFENIEGYSRPVLHKHATEVILKKCMHRILEQLDKYIRYIDIAVFAKYLGKDKVSDVIVKLAKYKKMNKWFCYSKLKPLLQKLPKEGKFEFVKSVFIDKVFSVENDDTDRRRSAVQLCSMSMEKSINVSSVYQWYRMAPFSTAFNDLKKYIRTESSPEERMSILKILITSAGRNMEHVHTLVQYFRKKHINEPAKFKAGFVSALVETSDTHTYDERTWRILEEIFHSLEVYSDNEDSYEIWNAVHCVVAYNILHDKLVPEAIHKKFMNNFSTFKKLHDKLDKQDREKLFNYLFQELQYKIDSKSIEKKDEFLEVMSTLNILLQLLKHWKKNLADFPSIRNLIKVVIENKVFFQVDDSSLLNFYNTEKQWRRCLFEVSLQLSQTEPAYMNAIKHNPALILQQQQILDKILKSNSFDLLRILSKLRIYFSGGRDGADWLHMYERKLEECQTEPVGYKAVTRGLCVLMPRDRFVRLMNAYVPQSHKVQWSQEDGALINLRKFFAQQMYLVRPTLDIDTVLLFAKGDYLQYALPSLTSIFHRKSKEECTQFLPTLLSGPVSLQKHGIRLAFEKMEYGELTSTFVNVWSDTKNASIRSVIFNLTFDLLCKQKDFLKIQELWQLFKQFMTNLTPEENRTVYVTMTKAGKVPKVVRAEFCVLSYNILKELPEKLNGAALANGMLRDIATEIESIDEQFVNKIILEAVNKMYAQKKILQAGESYTSYWRDIRNLMIEYLISSTCVEEQSMRYDKIFKPISNMSLDMWHEVLKKEFIVRDIYISFVDLLLTRTCNLFEQTKMKFVNPIGIFKYIHNDTDILSTEENYLFRTQLELTIVFCESYSTIKSQPIEDITEEIKSVSVSKSNKKSNLQMWRRIAPGFAEGCLRRLKRHLDKYFPSIHTLFAVALKRFLSCIKREHANTLALDMLSAFTADPSNVAANLVAISLLRRLEVWDNDVEGLVNKTMSKLRDNQTAEIKFHFYAHSKCLDL